MMLIGGSSFRLLAAGEQPRIAAWKSLSFRASKFGISARMKVRRLPTSTEPTDRSPHTSPLLGLSIETRYLGRQSSQEVHFAVDGRVEVARSWRDSGSSSYWNEWRYEAEGFQRQRRAPSNRTEAPRPRSDWTDIRQWFEPFPAGWKDCSGFTDAALLLHFFPSTTELSSGLCIVSKKALWKIEVIDLGTEGISVDYSDLRVEPGEEVQVTPASRKLAIRPSLLHGDPDDGFQLLGLEGDLEINLHPVEGFPLRLVGRMPRLGKVTVSLGAVE